MVMGRMGVGIRVEGTKGRERERELTSYLLGSKGTGLPMTDGADDGEREVASVADASHDDSEAEELGRRTTNKSHQDTHKTADDGTQHHIHRNEPPVPHVGQSHGLSQLRED